MVTLIKLFKGNQFTSYNKRKMDQVIFARLNRTLASHSWFNVYPTAMLTHLSITD